MGRDLQDSISAAAAADTIGSDFMLKVEWKKKEELSQGPSVLRPEDPLASTSSDDAASERAGIISTSDLVGVPSLVLQVSIPSRYAQAVAQLDQLFGLVPGWDGHDAAPVERTSVARAKGFLIELHNRYPGIVPPPIVGPLPDGGVALVWRTEKKEVEIDFVDKGSVIDSAVTDRYGERPEEFQERVGIDSLLSVFVPDHLIR